MSCNHNLPVKMTKPLSAYQYSYRVKQKSVLECAGSWYLPALQVQRKMRLCNLLQWRSNCAATVFTTTAHDKHCFNAFASTLVKELEYCFRANYIHQTLVLLVGQLWQSYHRARFSSTIQSAWQAVPGKCGHDKSWTSRGATGDRQDIQRNDCWTNKILIWERAQENAISWPTVVHAWAECYPVYGRLRNSKAEK